MKTVKDSPNDRDDVQRNELLALSITTALDVRMLFELYSYRVISPEEFMSRMFAVCTAVNTSEFREWINDEDDE